MHWNPICEIKSLLALAMVFLTLCANAHEWNFTKGVPTGGTLRKGALMTVDGLAAANVTNSLAAAGFELQGELSGIEAFSFEADLILGGLTDSQKGSSRAWYTSTVFDGTGGKPGLKCGLLVELASFRGSWSPRIHLGYGDEIVTLIGPMSILHAGARVRLRVVSDASRSVTIEFAGKRKDMLFSRTGPIADAGKRPPVIGDSIGRWHRPFDGTIRRVEIRTFPRSPFDVRFGARAAFMRGEPDAELKIIAENVSGGEMRDVRATLSLLKEGNVIDRREYIIGAMPSNGRTELALPFETRFSPGWRQLDVALSGIDSNGCPVRCEKTLRAGIGPRSARRMPAIISDSNFQVAEAAAMGFTDGFYGDGSEFVVSDDSLDANTSIMRFNRSLDEALVCGIGYGFSGKRDNVLPNGIPQEVFARHDATGGVVRMKRPRGALSVEIEAGDERLLKALEPSWKGYGHILGAHPALSFVLPYSERRDHAVPSWGGGEAARYRIETGFEMPSGDLITGRVLRMANVLKRHPDGIIPEDDPALRYLSWFWSGGDGWPKYVASAARAFRTGADGKGRFTTIWDPAVRCPPRWGSGRGVDAISQWIYADPDPMSVAGAAEEMLAMSAGNPGQKVFIHTQLMCYRRRIAPENVMPSRIPAWMSDFRDASFLAIPPDVLKEACWSMFAKPMDGYGFYAFDCVKDNGRFWYPYSNPETGAVMSDMLKNVLAPLGPVFLKLGRVRPDVAVFESFTSVVMGAPFAGGWSAPSIAFMQRARLDPQVVYEETILRDSLDGIKVLFAPECRFLTPSMIGRLRDFQKGGGLLVGDGNLNGALTADISLPAGRFTAPPKEDQVSGVNESDPGGDPATDRAREETLKASAAKKARVEYLRRALKGRYEGLSDSSSPEIVVYNRQWRDVNYLFAVNDRRTFGDYVGQWGRIMEKGLPNEGWVSIRDPENVVGAVYELSRGGAVPFVRENGRVRVNIGFETCDGRLFAFLRQPIDSVAADVRVYDERIDVCFRVLDAAGSPVRALLPVEVRIYDAQGAELDGAGYLAAENGTALVSVMRNLDDAPGAYHVVCRDRASGKSVEQAAFSTSNHVSSKTSEKE